MIKVWSHTLRAWPSQLDVDYEKDHAAQAEACTDKGHESATKGLGFDDIGFSLAIAVARVFKKFLILSFPFAAGIENNGSQ